MTTTEPARVLWRRRLAGLGLAAAITLGDQLLKLWLLGPMLLRERGLIPIVSFFDFRYAENRGISYGFLSADSLESRLFLFALTGAIALGVLVWILRERRAGDIAALSLVLGGALGNIIDRVRFTYVVDYADLHFGSIRPFAIFNLADAAITIGVVLLLARSLLIRDDTTKSAATTPERGSAGLGE
ncbi:signal peptidase II [Croceicoccus sp. F390]|uniref:Lipoprotein signal peptidase n=1 Tax=Croceicoccus esteveae TaxID=3075597 RepID=A0ABU2ZGS5_9SPHN|nr:signal peptidase II [Croceicoccus sp. F390]MDT0575798.1 signal peptidase II [Croceicoccus sp. F390]